MRTSLSLLAIVLLFVACAAAAQAAPKDKAAPKQDERAARIDQLVQDIFTRADKNHNHALNKTEFANAQAMLEETVQEWAQQGLIGVAKKPPAKRAQAESPNPELAEAASHVSTEKLARSNRISQAEFTFYVHAYVDQADQHVQDVKAAAGAQRKAQNAARAMRRRGVPIPRATGIYPY